MGLGAWCKVHRPMLAGSAYGRAVTVRGLVVVRPHGRVVGYVAGAYDGAVFK